MDLIFEVNGGILYATVSGEVDLANAIDTFTRIYREASIAGVKKALVDCSAIEGALSTAQRFELAESVTAAYHREGGCLRVAVIGRPPVLTGFGALVASNRGLPAQVFESKFKALEWLNN